MRKLRTYSVAALLAALVIGGGLIQAQPTSGGAAKQPGILPLDEGKMSPQEMLSASERRIGEMQTMLTRVVEVQQVARRHKDVIRLNCVNDKLLQVKQLLNIAEAARNDLVEAVASDNAEERYHQYSQVTISYEKVGALRDEAEACVGEEIVFLGPTQVETDAPEVADDPTKVEPFNFAEDEIDLDRVDLDRPSYASPYI